MNDYKKAVAAAVISAGFIFSSVFGTSAMAASQGTVTGSGVRLRSKPSTSSSILTNAYKGDKVTVKDKSGNWYNVVFNGKTGWMSADYIKISSDSTAIASRNNTVATPGWVTANSGLILRKSPSTSSARITVMPKGSQVTISSEKNGWSQVKYGNYNGWASSKYIAKTKPVSKATPSSRSSSISSQIVALAKQQLGKPYVYGAAGPNAFDCSGLTYYVYKKFGYSIPRTSSGQGFGSYAPTVSKSNLQPGDLIVFKSSGSGYHMGIYIGGNQFIHAPSTGHRVAINSLNESWYKSHYIQAKRVVK
ncbi:MAG: hypothetical protein PWP48_1163 [Clostridiales bacterium]|nr:hypothetical protein [Clostridiales bacterium]